MCLNHKRGSIIGTVLAAAAACAAIYGLISFFRNNKRFRENSADDFANLSLNAGDVRDEAKRTYVALTEKGDIREAAANLVNAAGAVARDAGSIACKAGTAAYETARDLIAKGSREETFAETAEENEAEAAPAAEAAAADIAAVKENSAPVVSEECI